MKKTTLVSLVCAFGLLLARDAFAQSARCGFWIDANFWEAWYEICAGSTETQFRIERTETIFAPAFSTVDSAPAGLCRGVYPSSVFPEGVYGRQGVAMTISSVADPSHVYAHCSGDLVRSRAAAIELAIDKSGSMGTGGKLQAATTAASAFVDAMAPFTEIRPGLFRMQHYGVILYNNRAEYLDTAPSGPGGEVAYVAPFDAQNASTVNALQQAVASGTTSIGAGLQLARTAIESHVASDEEPFQRPAILVLSDGMENMAPWIADELGALQSRAIPVYSIGFGEDYQIDAGKLADLSAATGGVYRHTNDPSDLTKFFLEVLVDSFADTAMLLDPKGTVAGGVAQEHSFPVAAADRTIVVVAAWQDPNARLALQVDAAGLLVSPPSLPAGTKLIDRGGAYKIIVVPVCRDGIVSNCARPGMWRASISAATGVSQPYSLTVITRSTTQLALRVPPRLFTGEPLSVDIRLFEESKQLLNARITTRVSVPAENAFHRVATGKMQEGLAKLPAADGARTLPERKGVVTFNGAAVARKTLDLKAELVRSGNTEGYRATLVDTRYPGSYDITVRAEWQDSSGRTLMREATASVFVRAKVSQRSRIAATVERPDKGTGIRPVQIDFTPLDAQGESLGLGLSDRIRVAEISERESFIDLGNGSYRLTTRLPGDWRLLRLTMDDMVWRVALPGNAGK